MTRRAKKLHATDVIDAERVENATHFNVHARRGPAATYNQRCETLAEAVIVRDEWEHDGFRPMVYALTDGVPQTIVPRDRINQERDKRGG